MMRNFRVSCLLVGAFALYAFSNTAKAACDAICADGEQCIAAALYPYVPSTEAFANAVCSAWTNTGQTTKLYLIADENVWDGGYSSDPVYTNGSGTSVPIDVFVYDAMYFDYWKTVTTPVPAGFIDNPSDFVPYAQGPLTEPNGSMSALPLLGCTNIMFYRNGDPLMPSVTNLTQFLAANPQGIYISPVPFDDTGAMMNLAGKTTIGVDYMVTGLQATGNWPSMNPLDPSIISTLTALVGSASYYNAHTGVLPSIPGVEDQYVRAGYFSEGYARTTIGFSESMSQMSSWARSQLQLRAFPWTDNASAPTMFYADVVGVNSHSSFLSASSTLPFTLANLMTTTTVMQDSIDPPGGSLSYLFPARTSVLSNLAAQDSLYQQMRTILDSGNTQLVVMPTTDRNDFHSFGGTVQSAIQTNFTGNCDMESATPIFSNDEAPSICASVCENNDGWRGTWSNISPPAWPGYSACGCNTCVSDSPLPPSATLATTQPTSEPELRRYQRN